MKDKLDKIRKGLLYTVFTDLFFTEGVTFIISVAIDGLAFVAVQKCLCCENGCITIQINCAVILFLHAAEPT